MASCFTMKAKDPEAYGLCRLLRSAGWSAPADRQKVYDKTIDVLHREERAFAVSRGRFARPFTRLIERFSTFRYPGLFNDYDAATKDDDRLLLNLHAENGRIWQTVHSRFAHTSSKTQRREFLKELVLDMVTKTSRGRVLYSSDEKTALEVARGATSDCSELSRYAYARLRLAGFKPEVVFQHNSKQEASSIGKNVSGRFHLLVAVRDPVNPNEYLYIDLQNDGIVNEPRDKRFLHLHGVMSAYHNNLGVHFHELHDKIAASINHHRSQLQRSTMGRIVLGLAIFFEEASMAEAVRQFDAAIRYSPMNAAPHYGKALLLWKAGSPSSVVRPLARRAMQLLPEFDEAKDLYSDVSD